MSHGPLIKKTGVVTSPIYLNHIPDEGHIESPRRLKAIYERLNQADARELYVELTPRPATVEELAWNHTPSYIQYIRRTAERDLTVLDPDTMASRGSWEAACLAAGGVFTALDVIADGRVQNALVLARPPGHHAERDHAMGFCLFNNVALGAYYAKNRLNWLRVAIIDWDLHHGNGTQHSFYDQNWVLYCSTHQYPLYPGSGAANETGEGEGRGFTVNVPMAAGAGDSQYISVFEDILSPAIRAFAPNVMLVSAGFDIHHSDPLGGMRVTEEGFVALSRILLNLASELCHGRIVFCLEGGYNLNALAEGVYAVLKECSMAVV